MAAAFGTKSRFARLMHGLRVERPLAQAAVGLACAAVATGLRALLHPHVGDAIPWVTFFCAVLVAGTIADVLGAAVALGACAVAGELLFTEPRYSLALPDAAHVVSLGAFAINAALCGAVGVLLRAALTRLAQEAHESEVLIARASAAQKSAEDALAQVRASERRKDEFLAMLGHELRNPLAPIRATLDVARMRRAPLTEHQAALIDRNVGTLARIVDDLLDVARVTQGKIELRREPLALDVVVGRAVDAVKELVDQRKHTLTVHAPERVAVDADPIRLEQVLVNLLGNAAKYTDPGGTIAVTIEAAASSNAPHAGAAGIARVRVQDTGQGMTAAQVVDVFTLFEQGAVGIDRAQGGLGIGLTIVKRLVELHGGRVWAESAGRGQGSAFVVELPAIPVSDLPAIAPKDRTGPFETVAGGARKRSVLVVDDNIDAADSVAELLEALGYAVGVAHDGPSAVARAREQAPDIVLLDIGLPGMDGYEVARELREGAAPRASLIAMTGYGQAGDREKARAAGFAMHLTKPVQVDALIAALERAKRDGTGEHPRLSA
jgi:signal transduction histidine kinase/ActR/RegA family two-component response regulator